MSKTIEMLKSYVPYNEQEQKDKQFFIDCEQREQILTRDNERCHLTASAFIVNKERTKMLCIYHNIYNSWTWSGGHADGDDDMLYVAIKEVKEETGLNDLKVLTKMPISIDSLPTAGHFKRGKFVPAHTHLNFAYALEADENAPLRIKEDENSGVAWLTFQEYFEKSKEPQMRSVIEKIIEKVKKI